MNIEMENFQKICLDFFRLAGMEFSLWDENQHNIYSFPKGHKPFCHIARRDPALHEKCLCSDAHGFREVNRTKAPYVYTCHMGLTEVLIPILQKDEIIGYLMFGQMPEEGNRETILERIKHAASDPNFRAELENALLNTAEYPSDKIRYCIHILKIMIDYMNLSHIIQKTDDTLFYRAKKYISEHISEPILPQDICKQIGISPNTLYKIVKKNEGVHPTAFIRRQKIEKAKRLLEKSNVSIATVADETGFSDANYFIRVFKSEVGLSPLRYRKVGRG
ncbi:MAG: PocR ligand-binding domain-containing protein [Clostridia bacterium]|nr:PocR ligand-binding domain-containing protein [Clostridia bacterium]